MEYLDGDYSGPTSIWNLISLFIFPLKVEFYVDFLETLPPATLHLELEDKQCFDPILHLQKYILLSSLDFKYGDPVN